MMFLDFRNIIRRLPFLCLVVLFPILVGCSGKWEVRFDTDAQSVYENAGTVYVPVRLARSSRVGIAMPFAPKKNNNVEVKVAYTVSRTAVNPTQHDLEAGELIVPPGSTEAYIPFDINGGTFSGGETVVVTLSEATGAPIGEPSVHTVTILKLPPPQLRLSSSDQSVDESVGTVTVRVDGSWISYVPVYVPFTVSGTATNSDDHDLANGTLTIPVGATYGTFTFDVVDDAIYEGDETIDIQFGTPTNASMPGTTLYTVTIEDNDPLPYVEWSADEQYVGEGTGTVTVTAELSQAIAVDATIPFTVTGTATNPSDHNLASGTVTITAGDTTADVTFTVVDDSDGESDETVILTMGTPTNADIGSVTAHTVNIVDNENLPEVNFSSSTQTVGENVGTVTVTATLDATSALSVTVPFTVTGTASNPDDHNLASGSITVTAGQLSGSTSFSVVDDSIDENTETVIATMGLPTNASPGSTNVQTINITDNDAAPTVNFSSSTQSVAESVGTVTVTTRRLRSSSSVTSKAVTTTACYVKTFSRKQGI